MMVRRRGSSGDRGNPNYKGRGALLCYLCDTPLAGHVVFEPCPAPLTEDPRVPKSLGRAGGQQKKVDE